LKLAYATILWKGQSFYDDQPRLKTNYEWLLKRADWLDPLTENDDDQFLSPD